jgi:putative flippase GtrA
MRNYLRSFLTKEAAGQFIRLAFIGGLNTVVDFALFNVGYGWVHFSLFWSVTIAFTIATALSYVLNRRWTFRLSAGGGSVRETMWFYVVNLAAWGVTVAIVSGAEAIFGDLDLFQANLAKVVATALILIPKFAGYRDVVFGKALRSEERGSVSVE